ncbi:flagellar protein MotY [Marinobacter xestospongiae]|uniref:OmpA family protein n=1 Tax=Marinobacter xestospongiae TaxID=994319 RepID=A0ABU3W0G6_9GAMM|nr:OmpA family protein [Marinobacter xestospongiae]MDV2080035.1 OmpA family protein [Marinobacter xestospongiae]
MLRISTITAAIALTALGASGSVSAGSFGAGIENSQWYLSESVFDCTLSHDVPGYGKAIFQHRAGESLRFYLEPQLPMMKPGLASVSVEAPSWRPGARPMPVARVKVEESERPLSLGPRHTMQLVQGLLRGMAPTVTREAWYGPDPVRVRVSNINFANQYDGYRRCAGGLLPVNYDQIKRSRIPFAVDSARLSQADRTLLDNIATYIQADPTVERIFVDGHTDRTGRRIHNRALSEERAEVVVEYLKARGVPADMITSRAHGDRFPAGSRLSENRRTTIRLQRQGDRPELQQANGYGGSPSNG